MLEEVLATIKKYNLIEKGDKIVIGVSGGPDSICLLHILNDLKNQIGFEIYVAHINHMIRAVADEETKYVEDFCKALEVPCFIKKVDVVRVAKEQGKGTEETGRNIRYDFFNEVLEKVGANKIATAHNKNDKVETVIFNILRGTGLSGLKGIEPVRENKYIRPLIEIEREDIESYCNEKKLNPKYDESNNESIYTRNKIRNSLIPYIKKDFNPNIVKTLNRLSEIAEEENKYMEKITNEAFNHICINEKCRSDFNRPHFEEIALDLKKFNKLEIVIKRRVILYTINRLLGTIQGIEKVNIEDIIKLCENNIGNKYLMPIKKIKILVKNKKIFFLREIDVP